MGEESYGKEGEIESLPLSTQKGLRGEKNSRKGEKRI